MNKRQAIKIASKAGKAKYKKSTLEKARRVLMRGRNMGAWDTVFASWERRDRKEARR